MAGNKTDKVKLIDIFWTYLQMGSTAFGFSALQKIKTLIRKKGWITETELEEGLALVQLYPGPIMVNLNTYIGYSLRGFPGALLSTLGFIIPTTILMIILSSLYFTLGKFSWIRPVFTGLEALVVGILINVVLDFGKRGIKNPVHAVISVTAFAVLILHLNVVILVFLALFAGALFLRPGSNGSGVTGPGNKGTVEKQVASHVSTKHWLGIPLAAAFLVGGIGVSIALSSDLGRTALSFFKIGSIAFGNGLTILPLIQADVVDKYHWLTLNQFVDGIALSQITPGPFLVISTFIGFKLGGIFGSLLTTFAIFSPSFILTLVFTEVFSHLKKLAVVKGALSGVLAAFVGLLAAMLLQLGGVIAGFPAALIFTAASFAGVRYIKLDILWIFTGGLILWIGLYALGIPV